MSKKWMNTLLVVVLLIATAAASCAFTLSLGEMAGIHIAQDQYMVSDDEFEMLQRYERLDEVFHLLRDYYYTEVDEEILLTGAVRGMMDSLGDPYTFYYTPEEMAEFTEQQEGVYEGVGMQILGSLDGDMIVTRTFKGSSAYEKGVRAGDKIVAVNDQPVSAKTVQAMNEAVDMIRGERGTTVKVTFERDGELIDFILERRNVSMNRVEYTMIDDIGYIMLYEFMGDAVDGFEEALEQLKNQGAKGLIIDVRSNPGGLLDAVVDICDMLLPEGTIVYMEDRVGQRETFYSDSQMIDMPLVVLVNESSASASEILAGAVQDSAVGTIVGQTTFGKGIVQVVIPFMSDGAGLQLTMATYYTPAGRCIHGSGVVPDVEVDDGGYDFTISAVNPQEDVQLAAALEILRKEID